MDKLFQTYSDFKRQIMHDISAKKMKPGEEFWPGAVFIQNKQDTFFMVEIEDISNASEKEDVAEIVCYLLQQNSPKYYAVVYPSWQEYDIEGEMETLLALSLFVGDLSETEYYETLPYEDEDGMLTLEDWGDSYPYEEYPEAGMWIRRAVVNQGGSI